MARCLKASRADSAVSTSVWPFVVRMDWISLRMSGESSTTRVRMGEDGSSEDRKSTRLNSSHSQISYAVFCLKKKKFPNHIGASRSSTIREGGDALALEDQH